MEARYAENKAINGEKAALIKMEADLAGIGLTKAQIAEVKQRTALEPRRVAAQESRATDTGGRTPAQVQRAYLAIKNSREQAERTLLKAKAAYDLSQDAAAKKTWEAASKSYGAAWEDEKRAKQAYDAMIGGGMPVPPAPPALVQRPAAGAKFLGFEE